jgi:cytochrome b6-f complex iron-sulfur subunit
MADTGIERRGGVPRRGLWAALVVAGAGIAGVAGLAAFLWPRRAGGQVDAGPVADYRIGPVRHFQVSGVDDRAPLGAAHLTNGRDFHLVRRPDGFVAFWHRCTHLGCTVPYRPEFESSSNGRTEKGLFRCPCHGSTFTRDEGDAVFGPAPRPLDTLPVEIRRGRVLVTVAEGAERRRQDHEPARVVAA